MYAENFLDLLAQKKLLSSDLLDGLRERLARTPNSIPAESFAERLVAEGLLTRPLSEALLRQLDRTDPAESARIPELLPLEKTRPVKPPPRPLRQDTMLPQNPREIRPVPTPLEAPPRQTEIISDDEEARNRLKVLSRKRNTGNVWDTKLILFGGAGFLALVLLALFLTGSLVGRSAEEMYDKANKSYDKASYSQAIIEYGEFIDAFPNHSGVSTAKIRRALARIRLLVDAKGDWLKTFETTKTEIESVENEPSFFDESKAELAVLLPKIAAGLAEEASEKTSVFHAERGEQMLEMIDRLLPRSLRPVEQLAVAKSQIDEVRRLLVRDDRLFETKQKLGDLLAQTPFNPASLLACTKLTDILVEGYPELENADSFLELMKRVSQAESQAVRPCPAESFAWIAATADQSVPETKELAAFCQRTFRAEVLSPEFPVVFLYASDSVFGLRATDGLPLWKQRVGPVRRIVPIPRKNASAKAVVLTVDGTKERIDLRDAETGEIAWSLTLGEPFFLSEAVQANGKTLLAAATRSGRLLTFSCISDENMSVKTISAVEFPRRLDSAPVIDATGRFVWQFAERDTLYRLSTDGSDETTSFFTGQKPSMIRTSPVFLGANLIFVRQTTPNACELIAFSPERGVLQRFPVGGLLDSPPVIDGLYLALVADSGEALLFELSEDAAKPLRLLARGSAGGKTDAIRYAALAGKSLWVADRQLTRFEAQLAQQRLLPGESLRRNIATLAPLFRSSRILFHAFRYAGSGGAWFEAVDREKATIFWETELADPIVLEPLVEGRNLLFRTSSGKEYRFDPDEEQKMFFQTSPSLQLPVGVFGDASLDDVIPLRNGFSAWIPRLNARPGTSNKRLVMLFDPGAPETAKFRSLLFPAPMAAKPIALDGDLLVPLVDGQVVLFDPKTGAPAAMPFVPPLVAGRTPLWSSPVAFGSAGEFLIVDNTPDEEEEYSLYRVGLAPGDGRRGFFARKRIALKRPVATPIAALGDFAVLIDDRNVVQTVRLGENESEATPEKSVPLSSPCLWGPYVLDDLVLWATSDSKLYILSGGTNVVSLDSPLPVGRPWKSEDGIWLNAASGALWRLDPTKPEIGRVRETGVRTRVGPLRLADRMILSGDDGTVHVLKAEE